MYYVVITRHLRLLVTIFHSIVSCIGQPVPRVIWYEDGRAIEGLLEYLPNKQIRNVLHIAQLSRANHNVRYSCAASNSRILPPLVSAITILMRRKSFLNFSTVLAFFPICIFPLSSHPQTPYIYVDPTH